MIFHDVQQNTDEWFDLRIGKVGGSSIGTVMANYGKAFGQPAHDLAVKIALEQLTGQRRDDNYTNTHMQRGHEQEPIARALYEITYFCDVANGGFFDGGGIRGVSPDGLVDNDGVIEIKSVIATVHFKTIKRGKHDPSYQWQLYYNLQVTGREWIDFISYCSEFPENKRLFVDRIHADDATEQFGMITDRLGQFESLVEEKKQIIESV